MKKKSRNGKETRNEMQRSMTRRFLGRTSSTALAECELPANFDKFKHFISRFQIRVYHCNYLACRNVHVYEDKKKKNLKTYIYVYINTIY